MTLGELFGIPRVAHELSVAFSKLHKAEQDIQKVSQAYVEIFTARETIIKTFGKLYSQRIPGTDKKNLIATFFMIYRLKRKKIYEFRKNIYKNRIFVLYSEIVLAENFHCCIDSSRHDQYN